VARILGADSAATSGELARTCDLLVTVGQEDEEFGFSRGEDRAGEVEGAGESGGTHALGVAARRQRPKKSWSA